MPNEKILIVDDEPNNLQVLRQILKKRYQLGFAKSGEEALRRVHELAPDLILLDIMMPGMDGYAVCEALKAEPSTQAIPVIFVTALDEVKDEARGFELGAVDYINKPVRPLLVQARVKTHLMLYNQQQVCEEAVRERTAELESTRLQIIQRLGRAAEYKDNETGLHVLRMSHYARILAEHLGWQDKACQLLLNAAPMHDIGKIGIPDQILRKPGKLDDEEWVIMRRHPEIGANIIGESSSRLLDMARIIALTHHERWDGQGYPRGLSEQEIPLVGRIITVADVFDALTTQRPYKPAWTVEAALQCMTENAGQGLDPSLVTLFKDKALSEVLAIKQKWAE